MDIQTQEPSKIKEEKCCLPCCSCSGWKMVVCVVVGLMIVAGAVYAGYFLGRRSISPRELLIPPKPIATQIPIDNGPVEIEVSPTPDITANWKTYTNKKLGFSVKLPIDLEVLTEGEQEVKLGNQAFKVVVLSASSIEKTKAPGIVEKTTLDSKSAEKFRLEQDDLKPNSRFYYLVVHTTEKPFIEIKYIVDIYNPNPEVSFDLILSTFQFLD